MQKLHEVRREFDRNETNVQVENCDDFSSSISIEVEDDASKTIVMTPKTRKKVDHWEKTLVLIVIGNLLIFLNFVGAAIFLVSEKYLAPDEDFAHSECLKKFESLEILDSCLKRTSKIDTFSRAFFYCWTLYSTVGYGNVYPRSTVGKIATVIYATLVIPVYISFKFEVGTHLAVFMMFIARQIGRFVDWSRDYLILASSIITCTLGVLVSSYYFSTCEKISYLSSLYFSVISMNLIGLGDIAPSNTVYFIVGYLPSFLILDVFSSHFFYFGQARVRCITHNIVRKVLIRPKKVHEIPIDRMPIINTQCMPMNVLDCEEAEISLLHTAKETTSMFE